MRSLGLAKILERVVQMHGEDGSVWYRFCIVSLLVWTLHTLRLESTQLIESSIRFLTQIAPMNAFRNASSLNPASLGRLASPSGFQVANSNSWSDMAVELFMQKNPSPATQFRST